MSELSKDVCVRMIAVNFSADLSEQQLRLWLVLLASYSREQVQQAATALLRRCGSEQVRFGAMPPFALMQRELDAVVGAVRGERNVAMQAEAEWTRLLRLLRECGHYREPSLPPVTALVVRQMGGWARACSWKDVDLPWRHREFIELWKIALGNEDALTQGASAVAALNSAKGRAALPAPDCPAPPKRLPLPPPPLKPDPSGPFALRLAKLRKETQKTQKIQRGK